MKLYYLVFFALIWTVTGQITPELLKEMVNGFKIQKEWQIGVARSTISSHSWTGLANLMTEIDSVADFTNEEMGRLRQLLIGLPEDCEANLPTTPDAIVEAAEKVLNECVLESISGGELVQSNSETMLADYQTNATSLDFWFMEQYFKDPKQLQTVEKFADVLTELQMDRIIWDNVDSIQLYNDGKLEEQNWETLKSDIDNCFMRAKENVGIGFGTIYLYLWDC